MTKYKRDNLLRYRRNNGKINTKRIRKCIIKRLKRERAKYKMKTYCLVCKNYTNNSNSRVVKDKQRLMLKSNCSVCGNKIYLLQRGLVYLIV